MPTFGRRSEQRAETPPRPPVPLRNSDRPIIVRRSAHESGRSRDLVNNVIDFVNFALREAQFNRDEISQEAMRSYHVDFYLAQVLNGGHGQYAGNGGMLAPMLQDCQEGLAAMGHPSARTHARFLAFAEGNPARFRAVIEGGGFGKTDPIIKELNEEFYAFHRTSPLTDANSAWLRTLPQLKVVDDARYSDAILAFAATNTQMEARTAAREQARREEDQRDPLKRGLGYLCAMAQEPRRFIRWTVGQPGYDLGDGFKLVRFLIDTDGGPASALFHPKMSLLFDDREPKTPRQIGIVPTEMVVSYVRERTGKDLLEVIREPGRRA